MNIHLWDKWKIAETKRTNRPYKRIDTNFLFKSKMVNFECVQRVSYFQFDYFSPTIDYLICYF